VHITVVDELLAGSTGVLFWWGDARCCGLAIFTDIFETSTEDGAKEISTSFLGLVATPRKGALSPK
jgi:hypothetical protein